MLVIDNLCNLESNPQRAQTPDSSGREHRTLIAQKKQGFNSNDVIDDPASPLHISSPHATIFSISTCLLHGYCCPLPMCNTLPSVACIRPPVSPSAITIRREAQQGLGRSYRP